MAKKKDRHKDLQAYIPSKMEEKNVEPHKPTIMSNKTWSVLMVIYVFLFVGIGYVAFWEQDFNDPDKTLLKFEKLRKIHYETRLDFFNRTDTMFFDADNNFDESIDEYMRTANDTAGDLQELATQSFHIVLGAFLAFLSATASIIFQSAGAHTRSKKN